MIFAMAVPLHQFQGHRAADRFDLLCFVYFAHPSRARAAHKDVISDVVRQIVGNSRRYFRRCHRPRGTDVNKAHAKEISGFSACQQQGFNGLLQRFIIRTMMRRCSFCDRPRKCNRCFHRTSSQSMRFIYGCCSPVPWLARCERVVLASAIAEQRRVQGGFAAVTPHHQQPRCVP